MDIQSVEIRFLTVHATNRFPAREKRHVKALPYLSIVQSVEGSYGIRLGNGPTYETGVGGFFIAPSRVTQDILHHDDPMTGHMQNRWFFIDARLNYKYAPEDLFDFPTVIPSEMRERWNTLFDRLFAAKDVFERTAVGCVILKELIGLGTPKAEIPNPALLDVAQYIQRNYNKSISVADLAAVAHLSESHFYAVFKKHYYTPPLSYLNMYRLTVASDLLIHTSTPIKDIALRVGIPDALYFSRLFQRTFRSSPRDYRRLLSSFS